MLLGADGGYAVGRFDGRVFTPEGEKRRGHWGNAFYASQTWSDAPDGRRVQIAWGTVNLPGMPFNQMMTFPCDLSLRSTPEGPRMAYRPVPEIEKLARGRERLRVRDLPPGEHEIPGADAELLDLRLEIEPRDAAEIGIHVRGVPLTWNRDRGELACLDRAAPVRLSDGKLRLRVLVDRASLEIFAEDGLVYMPMGVVLKPEARGVRLSVRGGSARLAGGEAAALRSAWERRP